MDQTQLDWLEGVSGILETLNQGVIIGDDCRRIIFANELFLQMIGRAAETMLGKQVETFYPPDDVQTLLDRIEETREHGHNRFEFYLPQSTGERLPVVITSRQMEDPDGRIFALVTFTDISEQKRAEAQLQHANSRLEERQRQIDEDLELAARIQHSLAPRNLVWDGVAVESFYQPARSIGGDFGLVAPGESSLNLLVCDVSGHGIGSALVANRIYSEAVSRFEREEPLLQSFEHLNRFVKNSLDNSVMYFTVAAARIARGARSLEIAGAGHPAAMLLRDGRAQLLESRSMVLGVFSDAVDGDSAVTVPTQPGDRIVLYTDGFSENFNARGEMLGVPGLAKIFESTARLPLAGMKHEILDRITAYRAGPPADDMSLVIAEII
jgi:sigma-B regulation protein RsbU (phosphoserine phosphatase)